MCFPVVTFFIVVIVIGMQMELGDIVLTLATVLLGAVILGLFLCLCCFPYGRLFRKVAFVVDNAQGGAGLGSLLGLSDNQRVSNDGFSVIPRVIEASSHNGVFHAFDNVGLCQLSGFVSFSFPFLFCFLLFKKKSLSSHFFPNFFYFYLPFHSLCFCIFSF